MRVMTMLEAAKSSADIEAARKQAYAGNWSSALFDAKAKPFVKLIAKLQRPAPKTRKVQPKPVMFKGRPVVAALGTHAIRVIPAAKDEERTPMESLAVVRSSVCRKVQGKFKVRVAIGPVLVSEGAWEKLAAGGMVAAWIGPKGQESMHYLQRVTA